MIYVIGTGWYGCHIGMTLLNKGYDIIMLDKTNAFFQGSSYRNQNRLHLGYHYPRSPDTIRECREGYKEFLNVYPGLSKDVSNNLYFIADHGSLTPLDAFTDISGFVDIQPADAAPIPIQKVNNIAFYVSERYINHIAAHNYFEKQLNAYLQKYPAETFRDIESIIRTAGITNDDIIINCTYNHLLPLPFESYELFASLIYKLNDAAEAAAYTVMDGAYFSLYPYEPERGLYTLTSVKHGPIWKGRDLSEAPLQVEIEERVSTIRDIIESEVREFIPDFDKYMKYETYMTSWKTKPQTSVDDRSMRHGCTVVNGIPIISVYGGKITGIFDAARVVNEYLEKCSKEPI